ncbi:MAG TPA: XRE family transcriptional regulator [Syntrophales bacterium]|nr:XRE family transcriptional regulator [Syntrophales bacterium]
MGNENSTANNRPAPVLPEAEIGRRIRSIRTEKKITLEALARETGFTKGYLSKVEKSPKSPPVSTLGIIARALGVTISALLGEEAPRTSLSLVRKDERPLIARDGTTFGYSYEALAYKYPNKTMEPFLLTLPLHQKKRTLYQHNEEEILFVIQGTMRFFHGGEEYLVHEGDCLYFDASLPHFGESVGDKEVKCLMVICNPGYVKEKNGK